MNIFRWWKDRKADEDEQSSFWTNFEKPIYNTERDEMSKIIQDILNKLDEIKLLVDDLKKDVKDD